MTKQQFCTECGTPLRAVHSFCSACGAPQVAIPPPDTAPAPPREIARAPKAAPVPSMPRRPAEPSVTIARVPVSSMPPSPRPRSFIAYLVTVFAVTLAALGAFGYYKGWIAKWLPPTVAAGSSYIPTAAPLPPPAALPAEVPPLPVPPAAAEPTPSPPASRPVPPSSPSAAVPGKYPQASERELNPSDLAALSRDDLTLMRNEIFARHGYVFTTPAVASYFSAQPWYRAQRDSVADVLTPKERINLDLIRAAESERSRSQ